MPTGSTPKSRKENRNLKSKNKQCVYCGCSNKLLLNIDHIIPLSRGGKDNLDNKQVCCLGCNQLKGPLTDSEYKKYLKALEVMVELKKIKVELPVISLKFHSSFYPDHKPLKEVADNWIKKQTESEFGAKKITKHESKGYK
jgi:hypothetical protein